MPKSIFGFATSSACGFVVCLILVFARGAAAAMVGAYYYPWYGTYSGGHSWTQTLRENLVPQQPPALGYYSSRSSSIIEQQIDESHRGNISFWAASWWGPNSAEDMTIRNNVLADPRAGELRYAVHYESTGRLGDSANPTFANLISDFQYLGQNYFNNPNYLKINGRPVVFLYLTRVYFNTQAGRDAVASLRQAMLNQFGVNPYLIGDDVFPGQNNVQRAALWDSITDFDVYGSDCSPGDRRPPPSLLWRLSTVMRSISPSRLTSASFRRSRRASTIPRRGPATPRAPRYLTDVPGAAEGSLFTAELNTAVLPNLDPTAGNILMVSTFNEWHEDTQIEPTITAAPTTMDNLSGTLAQGYSYSGDGDLYLDALRSATVPEPPTLLLAIAAIGGALATGILRKRRERTAASRSSPSATIPELTTCFARSAA